MTGDKNVTEETIKGVEFNFMLDLKLLKAKSAVDAGRNRDRDAMRREKKHVTGTITSPERLFKWCLTFNDERMVVPIELRNKLIETRHLWPNISKGIEILDKNRVACMASIKNLRYQLPKHESGKRKRLTELGQKFHINFCRNMTVKN